MAIKASGSLSLQEINAEFGLGTNLNAYRGVQWWTDAGATGTFTSSNLGFNQFYSKRKDDINFSFVGGANLGTSAAVTPSYSSVGAQVGDIAFVYVMANDAGPTAASGFNRLGTSYRSGNTGTYGHCWWKILTSGDISSPGSFNTIANFRHWGLLIIRGGTTATAKQSIDLDTGTTIDFTGITKNSTSRGLAAFVFDTDQLTAVYPANWTNATTYTSSFRMISSAIIKGSSYVDGSSISISIPPSTYWSQGGLLVEIT